MDPLAPGGKRIFDDLAVDHEARQVGQAARDALASSQITGMDF